MFSFFCAQLFQINTSKKLKTGIKTPMKNPSGMSFKLFSENSTDRFGAAYMEHNVR
jgi:hypothetical protein